MSDDESEISFEAATRAIRAWYYSEIRSIVDSAIKECNSEHDASIDEDERREWLTTWIDETTDGHCYVIYTYKAKCVCLASDNEDAYEDEIGERAPTVEAQACMAMRRDVWELIEARTAEWIPSESEDPTDETGEVA